MIEIPFIVFDDQPMLVAHAWSIIGRCRRVKARLWTATGWRKSGRASDDGRFRFYWVKTPGELGEVLSRVVPGQSGPWLLVDLFGEKRQMHPIGDVLLLLENRSRVKPEHVWLFSAYRTPHEKLRSLRSDHPRWARSLARVWPKTPEALLELRRAAFEEPKPLAPDGFSGHVLVSGLDLDTRSADADGEGALGVPPMSTLLGIINDTCFAGGVRSWSDDTVLGRWWDRCVDARIEALNEQDPLDDPATIAARIDERERQIRLDFCDALDGFDWGVPQATLQAARVPWTAWMCFSPLRFSDRAVDIAGRPPRAGSTDERLPTVAWHTERPDGRPAQAAGDTSTGKSAQDAARAPRDVLAADRGRRLYTHKSRVLFRLAGDIGHPDDVAIGARDTSVDVRESRRRAYDRLRRTLDVYQAQQLVPMDAVRLLPGVLGSVEHRHRSHLADFVGLRRVARAYLLEHGMQLEQAGQSADPVFCWHVVGHPLHQDAMLSLLDGVVGHGAGSHVIVLVGRARTLEVPLTRRLEARATARVNDVSSSGAGAVADPEPPPGGWHMLTVDMDPADYIARLHDTPPCAGELYAWAQAIGGEHIWGRGLLPEFERQLVDQMASQGSATSVKLQIAVGHIPAGFSKPTPLADQAALTRHDRATLLRHVRLLAWTRPTTLRRWVTMCRTDDRPGWQIPGWGWLFESPPYRPQAGERPPGP